MSAEQQPSFYDILGVPPTASTEDIRSGYRARIKAYHPDRNSSADAANQAATLNEAWHVLGNAERRRAYDAYLAANHASEAPASEGRADAPTSPPDAASEPRTAWTCADCGRAVPRYVDECRCGQSRPQSASEGSSGYRANKEQPMGINWWALPAVGLLLFRLFSQSACDDTARLSSVPSEQPASGETTATFPPAKDNDDGQRLFDLCVARLRASGVDFIGASLAAACARPNVDVDALVRLVLRDRMEEADENRERQYVEEAEARAIPPPTAILRNSGCEDGHWVQEVIADGEFVLLEDRSLWQIGILDRIDTLLWLVTEEVVVCNGRLINTDDETAVDAVQVR